MLKSTGARAEEPDEYGVGRPVGLRPEYAMEPAEQGQFTELPGDLPAAVPPSRRSRPAADAVFPEALGVGLVATLVVGLVAISILACFTLGHQGWRAQRAEGQALTEVFAAAAGHVADRDEAEIHAVFHQLGAAHQALRVAEWIGPDGQVRCRWPGTVAGQPGGAPAATAQAEATTAGTVSFTAPVRSGTNTPAGTLALTFAFSDRPQPTYLLLVGCAVIAIVTLLGYFALYRRLRRRLRPMDAIQRNLHDYAGGLEKEFVALSLSDSFGQVATGWNELIAQLTALRNQQGEAGPGDLEREALQRFETRTLRYMLDQLPIGILRFGREQRVTYANMAASRLLGHALEAVVGLPLTEAVEEEVGAALIGAYLRSVATTSIDRKRGAEEQQSTLRFALIPPPDSAPDSEALVMIEDVSHLQEADRARDNFLYHVTHELRTPLTNIQAYAETLTGPGFDDEQTRRECYNVIISETRRLSRLVENILNISQLEVGTARIELSEVDFVRLLRQIVQDHLGAADEKKIDLTLRLPPKVPKLRGDKQRLSVLMTNLIGNALKYTAEGGHVNVALEVHERCLRIAVADTGIGIAPEDQLHVFEKFYRAARDDVQTVTGTGLGLAIAREVARLHGGDIRLESQIAEGSKFVVELPRATGGS